MANIAGITPYHVTLKSSDGLDRFSDRTFTVKPGVRAFLPKDDNDNIMGFGIGRASKALGNNKYYQADEHNAWIDSPTISRRHAVLSVERNPPHLTIVNVAATHGLFVNDTRVDEKQSFLLKSGDTIRLSGEVRRGEELIPPRTFKVFAQAINNTPPSSPDDVPPIRSFKVPEADSDEESVDEPESSISDEQEISQIDPSETGFVEDSMVHPFSDVEASDDEGFDSGLPYGHEGHDYEPSDDEFDDDLEDHSQVHSEDQDHHEGVNQNRTATPQASLKARELLELQSPQPEKPNNQRLANLVAASVVIDLEQSSSSIFSDEQEVEEHHQKNDETRSIIMELHEESDDGEDIHPETMEPSATAPESSSDPPSSQEVGFGVFDSKQSASMGPNATTAPLNKIESVQYTRDREAESMQRFMQNIAAVNAQFDACGHQAQGLIPRYEESMDGEFPRPLEDHFAGSIAPSMSLDRILDSPAKDNKAFTSSDPPASFSGEQSERSSWIPSFTNASHQSATPFNPWPMYDHPVNEYHEGPFASVKIESMLNSDPPRNDSLQNPESSHGLVPAKAETEGSVVTKKSGISIFDIVENTPTESTGASDSIGTSRSLKRKIADLVHFSDAPEQNVSSELGTESSSSILPVESNKESQSEPEVVSKDLLKVKDLVICSRPHKKSKLNDAPPDPVSTTNKATRKAARKPTLKVVKTTLTTAAAGAVVGGLAVFSALAFLPEAIFQ